jgi:TatD DNase family protein
VIDFHCHLDLYPDPQKVAATCIDHCLFVLSVTTTPSAWQGTSALAIGTTQIRTAIGLHPQLSHERAAEMPLFEKFLAQTSFVGEIGLDGSPKFAAHMLTQRTVFDNILRSCASAGGRIMSIHSRLSASPVLDLLQRHPNAGVPVLHWFSGTQSDLRRAIKLGCWFSLGPAALRSKKGRELAAMMPQDRVLTESDGPFTQIDGVTMMPWDARHAIPILADLWCTPANDTEEMVKDNFKALLKLTTDVHG